MAQALAKPECVDIGSNYLISNDDFDALFFNLIHD